MTAENCFCLKRKLSIIKMYLLPLSFGCLIEIILILCVLFWFVVYQGESFYHPYIASFLKELEEKNIIKERGCPSHYSSWSYNSIAGSEREWWFQLCFNSSRLSMVHVNHYHLDNKEACSIEHI